MKRQTWRRGGIAFAAATLIPVGLLTFSAPASADGSTCTTHIASDFNGDGFADVATGLPGRTVAGVQDAGAVRVFYGGPSGIAASGTDQYFDQNTAGIFGAPTKNDEFGTDVKPGDFNGDCYADLAIGTPGENDITILYGSANGLTAARNVMGSNQSKSEFGTALAVGDFNGDGLDDLAGSAVTATDAGKANSGEVGIMYGSADGLQDPSKWINQSTSGVPGVAETNDYFGNMLAAGDFTGDGASDLAIATPSEDNGSVVNGGSVAVLLGSKTSGLTGAGAQLWTQSTPGVPGTDENNDAFGTAVAAGDVNGDGKADLVIGAQYEDVGSVVDAGTVTYLAGSSAGLTATGAKSYSQNTGAIPGGAEKGDQFGWFVSIGDFNGDGKGDIAVGTPFEDLGKVADAGTVTIIPGTASGPTDAGSKSWDQDTAGVGGAAEAYDDLGFSLFSGHIRSATYDDLVIGVPYESTGGPAYTGALNVLPGSPTGLTATGSQYVSEPTDQAPQGPYDVMGFSLG